MRKYSVAISAFCLLLLGSCRIREQRLDKLVLDNFEKTFIEKDLRFRRAVDHISGIRKLDYEEEDYHTLHLSHTVKEEESQVISNELFKAIAKTFENICVITKSGNIEYINFEYSLLKELRIFKTPMFNQNEINEISNCKNLMRMDLRYTIHHEENNIEIDSFPNTFTHLKKLIELNLDFSKSFEQNHYDFLIEYSRDSTNEDHYNPNFKYDHPLDFIWLPEFPESFGELPLKVLRMSGNKANTFQSCVGDLKELEELVLVGHNFDSGLEHIGRIKTLKRLQLDLGASSGKLPDDVFNGLEELEELNITWEDLPSSPRLY